MIFRELNSDTTQTRSLFKPHADGINIEFRLAHKDPNGNCTEGIVRLEHPSSADFSDNNKGVSYWDSKKYFNIWLVDQLTDQIHQVILLDTHNFHLVLVVELTLLMEL